MDTARSAAVGVAAATFAAVAVGVFGIDGITWMPPALRLLAVAALLVPAAVAVLVLWRLPTSVVAWLMLLGTFAFSMQMPLALALGDGWAQQLDRAWWPLLYAWPVAVAYVFPDGRLLSSRWRWPVWAGAIGTVGTVLTGLLDRSPFSPSDANLPNPALDNALALAADDRGLDRLFAWFLMAMVVGALGGAAALVVRLRRTTGEARAQTRWLAWSASAVPVVLLLCVVSSVVLGDSVVDLLFLAVLLLAPVGIAVSIAVAVSRHHLWAIDRIIPATAAWLSLTATLLLTYAAAVAVLGMVLGVRSPGATALATVIVALLFVPLRRRVQRVVDHRFAPARQEGVRLLRAFENDVRAGRRDPEEVVGVLAEALHDPSVSLLFRLPGSRERVDAFGSAADRSPGDRRVSTTIGAGTSRGAVLVHAPTLVEQPDLMHGVLAAAVLPVEMARLRAELRLQLEEVEDSRRRIVEAGYAERRRLERDLHDGAQQRLVSLGVRLRRLQMSLPLAARPLSPAIDAAVDEIGATITDLRQLAAGIRPTRLDDGLAAALEDLAHNAPVPVEVDVPRERLTPSIEAAAYFVACEALTNAVKHGRPTHVVVRAERSGDSLRLSIADDGVGGAAVGPGSGLEGLRDRVAAHGGTLDVVSLVGKGTHVEAVLPCGS